MLPVSSVAMVTLHTLNDALPPPENNMDSLLLWQQDSALTVEM